MKRFSHILSFLTVALLLGSFAKADGVPVDPVMGVSDPVCGDGGCPIVEGTTFSFFSNQSGGGTNQFQNGSTVDWMTLLINVTTNGGTLPSVAADTITCLTNAFATCQSFDLANGDTAIYLSGVVSFGDAIPIGNVATLNLNDLVGGVQPFNVNGTGGWGALRQFDVTANAPSPVPEPATITLLGVGVGTLLTKRKLRNKGNSSA
jgi:hypothetical protein